jgi:hypothetical protein
MKRVPRRTEVCSSETRLAAVEALLAASTNINETGWLNAAKRSRESQLGP